MYFLFKFEYTVKRKKSLKLFFYNIIEIENSNNNWKSWRRN